MKSAAMLAVLIATAAALGRGDGQARPAYPLPGAVAVLRPADALGAVAAGHGDAWVDDRWGERLLRLDHRTGRVAAAIAVEGRLALAAGPDAMWALQSGGGYGRGLRGPLLRIDPATNRVIARIPMPALGFGVLVRGDTVWVWGPDHLMRVEGDRVVQAIAVADEDRGETTGFAPVGGQVVVTTADGHLVRFDARTGAELSSIALPFTSPTLQIAGRDRLILTAGGVLAAVDPRTGAVLWRTRLGFRVGTVAEVGGALWTYGAHVPDPGDRVWKIDPASGARRGSVLLPAFSTMGMAVVDGTLWVTTASGRVLVLRR